MCGMEDLCIMKVQGSPTSSGYLDDPYSHSMERDENVVEMTVKDGVASVPTPLPMLGYRSPDIPGLIVADRLPPSARLVSAMYEATMKLKLKH